MSYKLFPGRTPTQMRIDAQRTKPQPRTPAPMTVNPTQYPRMHCDSANEVHATRDWLAHIAAGRIQVR